MDDGHARGTCCAGVVCFEYATVVGVFRGCGVAVIFGLSPKGVGTIAILYMQIYAHEFCMF